MLIYEDMPAMERLVWRYQWSQIYEYDWIWVSNKISHFESSCTVVFY